jgi:hypothetical protein
LKKEAELANQGMPSKNKKGGNSDDSDEEQKINKKRKRNAQEMDGEFESNEIGESKDQEANLEGIGKKNTRKKKQKEGTIFGGGDELAGAFDDGEDSDDH